MKRIVVRPTCWSWRASQKGKKQLGLPWRQTLTAAILGSSFYHEDTGAWKVPFWTLSSSLLVSRTWPTLQPFCMSPGAPNPTKKPVVQGHSPTHQYAINSHRPPWVPQWCKNLALPIRIPRMRPCPPMGRHYPQDPWPHPPAADTSSGILDLGHWCPSASHLMTQLCTPVGQHWLQDQPHPLAGGQWCQDHHSSPAHPPESQNQPWDPQAHLIHEQADTSTGTPQSLSQLPQYPVLPNSRPALALWPGLMH